MKFIKNKDRNRIILRDDDKEFSIFFAPNGDLYWIIDNDDFDSKIKHQSFLITKENYAVYNLFEKLYSDIENINIFENVYPMEVTTQEERLEYEKNSKERIKRISHYEELFNADEKKITWYSDEAGIDSANYVTIKKEEDFKIDFYTQEKKYDDFDSDLYIGIRFRNSGSRYDPFNIVFMKMYNEMFDLDDANELNHQKNIEEYLYNEKKLTLK